MQAVKIQTPMAAMAARELVSSASSVKILITHEADRQEKICLSVSLLCVCVCVC